MLGWDVLVMFFLVEWDIVLMGVDLVYEVFGSVFGFHVNFIYRFVIVVCGMNLFDNLDFEAVAEIVVRFNCWEFLLVVLLLCVLGGIGFLVNLIVIF